jgi:ADP-heptose:LPS heptosyltransferase
MSGTASHQERIFIIKLGALGDFVQSLGPMAAIRNHHPNAHIILLTTKPYVALAQASNYVDEVWIDSRPKWFEWKIWAAIRNRLNHADFTRVYDLQNNDRTSFYFKLFIRKPEWVGVAKGASHRNTLPERTAGLAYDGHVQTLGLGGVKNISLDKLDWVFGEGNFNDLPRPYALLVPGSAPNRPLKRWPAKHYAAIASKLLERNITPVVIGSDSEKNIASSISQHTPGIIDLTGKTSLFDIPGLARSAIGAIGNDTGPMHMIAPTGCPSIVLFSADSNPKRHAPKGHNVVTIQKDDLEVLTPETVWKAYLTQQGVAP